MKIVFLFLLLLIPADARANGSSGIGSAKIDVVDEVWVPLKKDIFAKKGNTIVRIVDQAPVLTIEEMTPSEAIEKKKSYNPATLGSVKAWEFIPDRNLEKEKYNSWIVCGRNQNCVHITADQEAGYEAGSLIGLFTK